MAEFEITGEKWAEWYNRAQDAVDKNDSAAYNDAYTKLYQNSLPIVKGNIRRILNGNENDIEDVTQEVYVKVTRVFEGELAGPDDPRKFPGWIKTVSQNTAKDFLRKYANPEPETKEDTESEKKEPLPKATVEFYGENGHLFSEKDGLYADRDEIERMEDLDLVKRVFRKFRPQEIEAFWDFTVLEIKQEELADKFGVSRPTISHWVTKIEKGLRDEERRSDRAEPIQLHAFTLLPLAGGGFDLILKESKSPSESGSWIGAGEKTTVTESLAKSAGKNGVATAISGRLIGGIVTALVIIAVAVMAIVVSSHRSVESNVPTSIPSSTVSQRATERNETRSSTTVQRIEQTSRSDVQPQNPENTSREQTTRATTAVTRSTQVVDNEF